MSRADDWQPNGPSLGYQMGIYGWRKRCLYLLILFMVITLIINMALTVWIIRVMNFNIDGMGSLHVTPDGIRVEGKAEFAQPFNAEEISATVDKPLTLSSDQNVYLKSYGEDGQNASLAIGGGKMFAQCDSFQVTNSDGDTLFGVSGDQVSVATKNIHIAGSTGRASFSGNIQTSSLESEVGQNLRLSSPTRSVSVVGPRSVVVQAAAGSVQVSGTGGVQVVSPGGHVTLRGDRGVQVLGLQVSQVSQGDPTRASPDVAQVCVCSDTGKLFVAARGRHCVATVDFCTV